MKTTVLVLIIGTLLTDIAQAQDCKAQFNEMKQRFYTRYKISERRKVTQIITKKIIDSEHLEIKKMAIEFNSVLDQNRRIELQNQAKQMTRLFVTRAGYKILNPVEGSPYDAQIGEVFSSDGNSESIIEVRSLLIYKDAFPHVTIWMNRFGPVQNPWQVVTIGIMNDSINDYVSWKSATDGKRVSDSVDNFIRTLLPVQCRL